MIIDEKLEKLRDRTMNLALVVMTTFATISYIFIFLRSLKFGVNILLFEMSLVISGFILLSVLRKKIPLKLKIYAFTILILCTFCFGLYTYGFLASAKFLLIIIPVFFSFTSTYRNSLITLFLFLIIYTLFGFLYSTQYLKYTFNTSIYLSNYLPWVIDGITLLLSAFGILYIGKNYTETILENYNIIKNNIAELKDREEKYRLLFETSNDTIILIDGDKFFDCNEKAYNLFNCNREFIIGKNPYLFSPEYQPDGVLSSIKVEQILSKVYNGEPQFFEWQHLKQSGELFDVYISLNLVILNNKKYVQAVLRDITEQKKNEAELQKHREMLENLVKERTIELEMANEELRSINEKIYNQHEELKATLNQLHMTQKQLIESEKMASIGILTAGIAHEINNPLNFIQAGIYSFDKFCATLDNLNQNTKSKELKNSIVTNINEGVNRISDLVQSLNNFNRTNNLEKKLCNLPPIINNCLRILHHKSKNNCEVILDFNPIPIPILGNEGKLHQAILNIIDNAIQAIIDNGIITITTKLSPDNKKCLVQITDNGIGIPEENLSKVFNPFFTTKEVGKGTGLGLSIAYEIIKEHDGEIFIESLVNKGTRVTLVFPLPKVKQD